jgi:hypothetical protein
LAPGRELLADNPPPMGASVSILNVNVCVCPDCREKLSDEKWQLTKLGKPRQPIWIESEKPLTEETATETVPLCPDGRFIVPGEMPTVKLAAVPDICTEADVEGACNASPP